MAANKRHLSKSKLISYRQCPKRLWLEIHRPELRQDSASSQAVFKVGHQVGDLARQIFDPLGQGVLVDLQADGYKAAIEKTAGLLSGNKPIFEAGFSASGAVAFCDVLIPSDSDGVRGWRMIEVKASTSVKPYHEDDVAIPADGSLSHAEFLGMCGADPREAFAAALVQACQPTGPIFVYNAGFEGTRIRELAEAFPALSTSLFAIKSRLVDLHPIAVRRFYHPSQQGSWSIKKILPAIAPDLAYESLGGVQNGDMAMDAYLEALNIETQAARREDIRQQLFAYCKLDTLAMVRIWQKLTGQSLD